MTQALYIFYNNFKIALGIPQGPVLGPLEIYTLPLTDFVNNTFFPITMQTAHNFIATSSGDNGLVLTLSRGTEQISH